MARGRDGRFKSNDPETREMGRKGGKLSSGSFRPGSEKARAAGRKGGKVSSRGSKNPPSGGGANTA